MNRRRKRLTGNQAFMGAMTVRDKYRESLLALGKSPDTHVYDLSHDFLGYAKRGPERSFLIRVKVYYEKLTVKEQTLFLNEVLERGRGYRFWYLVDYNEAKFRDALSRIYHRVASDFEPAKA